MKTAIKSVAIAAALLLSVPASADDHPDPWLTVKSKIELLTAEDVPGTKIAVDTFDRRVALYGTVPTGAAKIRAEGRIKHLEGVRDVINFLQVVPDKDDAYAQTRRDKAIREDVTAMLELDPALEGEKVSVQKVHGGTVKLKGKVNNPLQHLAALETTASVRGVVNIISDIEVESDDQPRGFLAFDMMQGDDKSPSMEKRTKKWAKKAEKRSKKLYRNTKQAAKSFGQQASDATTTAKVKMKLLADADVPATDINVDTRDGTVTLFGIVDGKRAKHAAARHARHTAGVKTVNNYLAVVEAEDESSAKRPDTAIEKDIEKKLTGKDFDDVNVKVRNGIVYLSGDVASLSQRVEIAMHARSVDGVIAVHDRFGDRAYKSHGKN